LNAHTDYIACCVGVVCSLGAPVQLIRDMKRDMKRDVKRDMKRDVKRDMASDVKRDFEIDVKRDSKRNAYR